MTFFMVDIYLYIILTDFILIFHMYLYMYLYNRLYLIIPFFIIYTQSNKLEKNVLYYYV